MDLLTVSSIYHAGGTMLLLRLTGLAAALLLVMALQRRLGERWPTAVRLTRRSIVAVGAVAATWLVAVELWLFRSACLLCVIACLALLAGFVLGWRQPAWRRAVAAALLFAAGLGYLFPFGTVPKVFALGEPAPRAEGYSAMRVQGRGTVLVQEFGDFQCPACAQMDRTLERLLERNEGQVQVVFRHLPLRSIHPMAEPAALASECAAWQGRFPEAKRLLFARQGEIGALVADPADPSWGVSDPAGFRACIEERHAERAVEEDVAEARRLGLRATPSIVIGQMLVVGATSLPRLQAVLDLAQAGAPLAAAPPPELATVGSGCAEGVAASPCGDPAPVAAGSAASGQSRPEARDE